MNDVRDDPIPRVVMGFSFSSIRRVALLYILVIHFLPAVVSRPARSEPIFFDQTTAQRLLGQHDLTMRWPGNDTLQAVGEAKIVKADNGDWHLTSRHVTQKTQVELDGTIIEVDAISFKFNGRVIMRVSDLAGGKACRRNGPFTFLQNDDGPPNSWHLLQAANPCGTAIDSVDLYLH